MRLSALRDRADFDECAVSDQLGDANGRPGRVRLGDELVLHLHESTQMLIEST